MPDFPAPSTRDQHRDLARALIDLGYDTRQKRLDELARRARRPVPVFAVLSHAEATAILGELAAVQSAVDAQDRVAAQARADGWLI